MPNCKNDKYCQISNISHTKSQNLNVSHHIWMITNFIAYKVVTYIRGLMVHCIWHTYIRLWSPVRPSCEPQTSLANGKLLHWNFLGVFGREWEWLFASNDKAWCRVLKLMEFCDVFCHTLCMFSVVSACDSESQGSTAAYRHWCCKLEYKVLDLYD